MNFRARLGVFALGLCVALPAYASDKQDFAGCDGRMQPGRQDDGMRGVAPQTPYESRSFRAGIIGSCTRALASPRLLPTQTLRRAHLLRARAAEYLRIGNTADALADLDQAEVATKNLAADRFFNRSMAVSLKLLRAIALTRSGNIAGALPLVNEAMQTRPYSLQVQEAGALILQASRPIGATSPSPWTSAMRLNPMDSARAILGEAQIGNFAGVVALRPSLHLTWPTKPIVIADLRTSEGTELLLNVIVSLHVAYARAATGDITGAHNEVADVRAKLTALRSASATGALLEATSETYKQVDAFVDNRASRIEARIAVAEARYGDAVGALIANTMPRDAATLELMTSFKAKAPTKEAGFIPDLEPLRAEIAQARLESLDNIASQTLVASEDPRAVIDYARARPDILGALVNGAFSMGTSLLGGVKSTDGFRSTSNTDGTIKVEYVGNTPSAALVQEMTLLRAAEVAREAGKQGFVIVDRSDYSRMLTMSRHGIPIDSRPTGFKTELTIRLTDAAAQDVFAFDAVRLIDALGPFYYEAKPGT